MSQTKPSGPLGRVPQVQQPRLRGQAPIMAPRPFTQVQVVKKACKCGKLK